MVDDGGSAHARWIASLVERPASTPDVIELVRQDWVWRLQPPDPLFLMASFVVWVSLYQTLAL